MKWLASILVALVLLMPVANAAEASTQTQVASTNSIKLKRMGEAFDDLVFKVKAFFTFKEESKLDLLKERNEQMKARQKAWLEIKVGALEKFESGNMTAKEKQEVMTAIKAEHEAIIKEHLRLTAEIQEIKLNAKAKGNVELETGAEETAKAVEESNLTLGLNIKVRGLSAMKLTTEGNLTAEEAKVMVQKKLGFGASEVRTEIKDNTTFYVVTGKEAEVSGDFELEKSFEVWVEAETGLITSVDMDADIDVKGSTQVSSDIEIEVESREHKEGKSKSGSSVETKSNVQSDARGSSDAQASGKGELEVEISVG